MTLTGSGGNSTVDTTGGNIGLSGILGGNAALNKVGAGMLTLSASNTFSGLTTISGGTLQLGDGVFSNGSVAGNILNNATLSIASVASQTYVGQISGSGNLNLSGGLSTLTLTGSSSYTGTTTIAGGTLAIGSGGSGASIGSTSGVVNNGSLAFNHADTVTFSPGDQR